MAFWICDIHNTAGRTTKRDDLRHLFDHDDRFKECQIRIVSKDNALALGWKGLD